MNLPDILNVALGIVVLYVLLSSIASLLLELLTGAAHYREEILYVTINRLLAGVPDAPWNLSRLVLDRMGRRLPEGNAWFGIAAALRKVWVKDYEIIAPGRSAVEAEEEEERRDIVQRFWSHPKIRSLAVPGADAPPAIEAVTFANVVIDIAIPRDAQGALPDNRLSLLRALAAPSSDTPDALLQTLRTLGLSSEISAGATGEALWLPFRRNVAAWFDEAAARSSEIYRRTMQRLLLGVGLLLALLLNADTVRTVHLLSHDRSLREAVAAYSETLIAERNSTSAQPNSDAQVTIAPVKPNPVTPSNRVTTRKLEPAPTVVPIAAVDPATESLRKTRATLSEDIERLRELDRIGFPIGWAGPDDGYHGAEAWFQKAYDSSLWTWLAVSLAFLVVVAMKLIGLSATALAVSLGAPFWYEAMNRLIGLRKGQTEAPPPAVPGAKQVAIELGTGSQVVAGSALPLEIGHDLASPATSFSARKAYWLARASAAAYSPPQEINALVRDTWKFHECHFIEKAGTQAFCASDEQIVLIAFRGTELSELNDILADVNARFTALTRADYKGAPARTVHKGFHDSLELVWEEISAKILAWTEPKPGRAARQIFITGHSLGGALATLMFARLAIDPARPVPTLYTFGCPKVGDNTFVRELDRLYPERVFRFINDSDIVPQLPPLPEFHHAGRELIFDTAGALRSEMSGLSRLLGYAAAAAKSIKGASRKAVDDHAVAYYVARCEALAKLG